MIELEDAIRMANPVPATQSLDLPTARTRAQAIVLADRTWQADAAARRKRGRRFAQSMLVSAMVLSLVILGSLGLTQRNSAVWAGEILDQAAAIESDPESRPDQYWRIEVHGRQVATRQQATFGLNADGYVVSVSRANYVSVGGAAPDCYDIQESTQTEVFGHPVGDFQPIPAMAFCTDTVAKDLPGGWDNPNPGWVAQLPRDTAALRVALADHAGDEPGIFRVVSNLLISGRIPADVRSSLLRVLTSVPGIRVVDESVGMDGRTGVAVGMTDDRGVNNYLLFDGETKEFIGSSYSLNGGRPEYGLSITRTVVDTLPADLVSRVCAQQTQGALTCSPR